jgi:DNA repair proteins
MSEDFKIPVFRIELVLDSYLLSPYRQILNAEMAAEVLRLRLARLDRETMMVLILDHHRNLTGCSPVSMGTIKQTFSEPPDVYKAALKNNAAAIIIGHNHPTGNVIPSKRDQKMVQAIHQAGEIMGIELLDSIIVGNGTAAFSSAHRENYLIKKPTGGKEDYGQTNLRHTEESPEVCEAEPRSVGA